MTRFLDILLSLFGLILLLPLTLIISLLIKLDSKGPVFYKQLRVGKSGKDFLLYKFRSMYNDSEKKGALTIGRDSRVTNVGRYLRKYKIDEIPQLINVLVGDMSLVGPRPEVRKYVQLYTEEQKQVLSIRPGITDIASITYYDENELLAKSPNPEDTYINYILPEKIRLNMIYINDPSLTNYLKITIQTIFHVFRKE